MGFIKRSDGDIDHVIDRVFADMDEVAQEIAKRGESEPAPELASEPAPEQASSTVEPPDGEAN